MRVDLTNLFSAHPGETLRLRFAEVDNINFLNAGIDQVSIMVPEPATLTMVLGVFGLISTLFVRQRRRQQNAIEARSRVARQPLDLARGTLTVALLAIICLLGAPQSHATIVFGEVDTFQDGTTMNWQQGASSPNPTMNIANGGPAGVGDAYLQNVSSGGFGAGSKMVMFNQTQWIGNYVAAGVDRITAQMANFGSTVLHMRIAVRGGPGSTIYSSTSAADVAADGLWHSVTFDLTTSALTNIGGGDTLSQVLSSVSEFRVLSAIGGPSFSGDPIQATLGVDNMTKRDIAGAIFRVTQMDFDGTKPRISFTTLAGRGHRVERKNELTDQNWVPLSNASNVTGTGGVVQIDDTEPGAGSLPKRFYRVVLLQP